MSEVMGLYPNVVLGFDDSRLCFIRLNSNSHRLMNIPKEQYTIKGNTIIFHSNCSLQEEELSSLVVSGYTYRLLNEPRTNPENSIHSYNFKTDDDFRGLFTLTFVLDRIKDLPDFFYPFLYTNSYQFTDECLRTNRIKECLSKMWYVRRIRLLSNDILNSDVLLLPELEDLKVEIIVPQGYYINHLEEFSRVSKRNKIIVYINDISQYDQERDLSIRGKRDVSYYCQINNEEDLKTLAVSSLPIIPFPSAQAPVEVIHSLLDYTTKDLMNTTIKERDLLLKTTINPFFYGSILVDNCGHIRSYPFIDYTNKCLQDSDCDLRQMKDNPFWCLKRSTFFEKCKKCALIGLCPPLSNYEINLHQTFCIDK